MISSPAQFTWIQHLLTHNWQFGSQYKPLHYRVIRDGCRYEMEVWFFSTYSNHSCCLCDTFCHSFPNWADDTLWHGTGSRSQGRNRTVHVKLNKSCQIHCPRTDSKGDQWPRLCYLQEAIRGVPDTAVRKVDFTELLAFAEDAAAWLRGQHPCLHLDWGYPLHQSSVIRRCLFH